MASDPGYPEIIEAPYEVAISMELYDRTDRRWMHMQRVGNDGPFLVVHGSNGLLVYELVSFNGRRLEWNFRRLDRRCTVPAELLG